MHWQYLKYVLRHKWFVYQAGRKIGAPLWRLLIHDWSKFLPCEWRPYAENFYGKSWRKIPHLHSNWEYAFDENPAIPCAGAACARCAAKAESKEAFDRAWLHHIHRNPHHWDYWICDSLALEMPAHFVREMVADWTGAGRAIDGSKSPVAWYLKNYNKIQLHQNTRRMAERLMAQIAGVRCNKCSGIMATYDRLVCVGGNWHHERCAPGYKTEGFMVECDHKRPALHCVVCTQNKAKLFK